MYDCFVNLTIRPYLEYSFDLYSGIIESYIDE
jgi:hypothetical protein